MVIEDNILVDEIQKGLPYLLAVESTDLVFDYDEIMAALKYENRIDAPAVITLILGGGITATDATLALRLTDEQTKSLKAQEVFMDVKARYTDMEPVLIFEARLRVRETITDI